MVCEDHSTMAVNCKFWKEAETLIDGSTEMSSSWTETEDAIETNKETPKLIASSIQQINMHETLQKQDSSCDKAIANELNVTRDLTTVVMVNSGKRGSLFESIIEDLRLKQQEGFLMNCNKELSSSKKLLPVSEIMPHFQSLFCSLLILGFLLHLGQICLVLP